jgi:hypothetical protein
MGDECNRLAAAMPASLFFQPRPLRRLGVEARTQKLCVDRQDHPAADRHRPVVGADDVHPSLTPGGVHVAVSGGARGRVVADVMVARDRAPRRRQPVELGAAMTQIGNVVCPVEAEVAEVDHQIRGAGIDVTDHGIPVGLRLRRRRG